MAEAPAPDEPVYLLVGSDRPKIRVALERLRAHFPPEAVDIVSALETTGEAVVALCNAGTLLGDRRLVIVEDVDGRRDGDGRRKGGWKAADLQAITAYAGDPAPETVLALVAEELKKSAPLWKACEKAGRVLTYDVEKKQVHAWVTKGLRDRGVAADPEAVTALVALVGEEPELLAREVEKIATWAQGEPVGEREVLALAVAGGDVPIYELTDAWAAREPARALTASERIFEQDARHRRDTAARLAGALGGHLSRLRTIKRLAAEGLPAKEVASRLKLNPYYASKLYRQAEGFSERELDDAVVRVAELDGALKGRSRMAADLELQRALVDLTRRPGERG
jgi:DNA polymerase-3 subunit delta